MAYRDTAARMYSDYEAHIEMAELYGKKIVLAAETADEGEDIVTYFEEGKELMYSELTSLNNQLADRFPADQYGLAIHSMRRWYDLKVQ